VEEGGDSDYDTVEVKKVDGTIERIQKPVQTDSERDNEELERRVNIQEDERHALIGQRRKARMAITIHRAVCLSVLKIGSAYLQTNHIRDAGRELQNQGLQDRGRHG